MKWRRLPVTRIQVVSQSGGRFLEIGVRKDCSGFFKMSADPAENLGRVDIKGRTVIAGMIRFPILLKCRSQALER